MAWVVNTTTRALYPRERPDTHCIRLNRPQNQSGQVRKIAATPGFDPRTVHPVQSRHTDYAIPTPGAETKRSEILLLGKIIVIYVIKL